MPIYTYRCENCGVQFERNQKFSDTPLTRCPECGKKSLRKVYMPVGIVFKGSGFYATDHRSPSGGGRMSGSAHSDEKYSEEKSSEEKASKEKSSSEKSSSENKPASNDSNSSKSSPSSGQAEGK
jgi:putative FmdB family regulatory protein